MYAIRATRWSTRPKKTLTEMGDKLDAADKSEVETKLSALKQALTGTDTAAIKAATEELTQAF